MTKLEKDVRASLAKMEATRVKLAKLRDVLRDQVSDVEEILENFDTGIDNFEDGLRAIKDAVDEMSKNL